MRVLLTALLGVGVAALVALPDRRALLLALAVMLLAFLLAGAKLAVDLIELTRADLVADVALLVVLVIALTRVTTGNRVLVTALLALALLSQAVPLVAARRRAWLL